MKKATFHIHEEGGNTILIGCGVKWDTNLKAWMATDEHGHMEFAETSALAALKVFTKRLTPEFPPEIPG